MRSPLLEFKTITGCDAPGDPETPYLTRISLRRNIGPVKPTIHIFHRSDSDDMHDHPFDFLALILWRGYIEVTECPQCKGKPCPAIGGCRCTRASIWISAEGEEFGRCAFCHHRLYCDRCNGTKRDRRRIWPGMILYRRAEHVHRVILPKGRVAVTFLLRWEKRRDWGFFTPRGWVQWEKYVDEKACEKAIPPPQTQEVKHDL